MSTLYIVALGGAFFMMLAVVLSAVREVHRRPAWLTKTVMSPLELAETERRRQAAAALPAAATGRARPQSTAQTQTASTAAPVPSAESTETALI